MSKRYSVFVTPYLTSPGLRWRPTPSRPSLPLSFPLFFPPWPLLCCDNSHMESADSRRLIEIPIAQTQGMARLKTQSFGCVHVSIKINTVVNTFLRINWIGLSSVLRPRQHSIGYMGDGFYRSKDPTNSIKVLKEQIVHRKIKTYNKQTWTQNTASPLVYNNMGWLGDGSHRGQGCQTWTAVGLPPRYPLRINRKLIVNMNWRYNRCKL